MYQSLSVVAPAYNEGVGIGDVLGRWVSVLDSKRVAESIEIVIGDDGSTDNTREEVLSVAHPRVAIRCVSLEVNRGAGVALRAAIQRSRGEWVLLTDSDDQFPIDQVEALATTQAETGADLVVGKRITKRSSMALRLGSSATGSIVSRALAVPGIDSNSAFKLCRGHLLRSLPLEARHLNYSADVLTKMVESGALVAGVPILQKDREHGTSSAKLLKDGTARIQYTLYCALRHRLVTSGVLAPASLERDCSEGVSEVR